MKIRYCEKMEKVTWIDRLMAISRQVELKALCKLCLRKMNVSLFVLQNMQALVINVLAKCRSFSVLFHVQ